MEQGQGRGLRDVDLSICRWDDDAQPAQDPGRIAMKVLSEFLKTCDTPYVLLLRAGYRLPPYAIERFQMVVRERPETGAISALCPGAAAVNPIRPGITIAAPVDVDGIDSALFIQCHQWAWEDDHIPPDAVVVSVRAAEKIKTHSSEEWPDWLQRLRQAGHRTLVCGRVFVADPESDLISPELNPHPDHLEPASSISTVQSASTSIVGNTDLPHAWPGLEPKAVQLHVLHGWGGGARKWVQDYVDADSSRINLILTSEGNPISREHGQWLNLRTSPRHPSPLRKWPLYPAIGTVDLQHEGYLAVLAEIIQQLNVDGLVVSSLIGHSLQALELSVPTAIVMHDYFPAWPRLDILFTPDTDFDDAALAEVVSPPPENFEFKPATFAYWRALRLRYTAALERHTLIAPSISVKQNLARLAPKAQFSSIEVLPHGIPALARLNYRAPAEGEKLRVVILGRLSAYKGQQLLGESLAGLLEVSDLYLIGCGKGGRAFRDVPGVHMEPDYQPHELETYLEAIRPHVGLMLSTVSETFSYTLWEMLAAGLPVIATAVGNLQTVLEDSSFGLVCDLDPQAVVSAVTDLANSPNKLTAMAAATTQVTNTSPADMVQAHHRIFPLEAPGAGRLYTGADSAGQDLVLSAANQSLLLAQDEVVRLADLQEASELELKKRAAWGLELQEQVEVRTKWAESLGQQLDDSRTALDEQAREHVAEIQSSQRAINQLQNEFDKRTRWAMELDDLRLKQEAELLRLYPIEAQRDRMLKSRSWRLTKPVRAATRRARRVRDRLAFARTRLGFNLRRTRNSLGTRGLSGTLQRARKELRQGNLPPAVRPPPAPDTDVPIRFEPTENPKASIIIPVFNAWEYTQSCLQSLSSIGAAAEFEVIVVNDASSDQTAEALLRLDCVVTVTNASNLGFIGSCNAGAAKARGEFVVFLNNDTTVTPEWLDALLQTFSTHPDAGLVGAKLIYPDGTLQEAGGVIFSDASGWNYGRGEDPSLPQFEYTRTADYISGAAIMMRRSLFESLGCFDSRYAPAYYEDTDMAFQVRNAGHLVVYQPRSVVVHYEGISSGTDLSSGMKRYQIVNQDKFREKWAATLPAQPQPGTTIHLAATHQAHQRALVIDACTPTPDQDSGSVRITNLMQLLLHKGFHVSFLPHNMAYEGRYTLALQNLGIQALYQPYVTTPHSWLQEFGQELDFVFISRHYVALDYLDLIRSACPNARFIFDTVDLHYLREQRLAALEKDPKIAAIAETTKASELSVIESADMTLVVSPVEKSVLATELPDSKVEVLSNIHSVPGRRRAFEERKDIWFVGGFQHPPNVDAVHYCVAEILPLIRTQLPDIKLIVVGSKAPAELQALNAPGLEFRGFVEDLDPLLDGCRLAIAPLRYGAGVKGKVNMSMSYGQPVIATPPAVEGMHVENGREVLVGDSAASFAQAVVQAYSDPDLWLTLSDAGIANVQQHFSFEAAGRILDQILTPGPTP